jgi:hypothetical protein
MLDTDIKDKAYITVESTHRPVLVLFVASRPGTSQGLALKTTVIKFDE